MPDYKSTNLYTNQKKYISVKNYEKRLNSTLLTDTASDYSDAVTHFMGRDYGITTGTGLAQMTVTYYAYFQQPNVTYA